MFPSTDWSCRAGLLRNSLSTQLDYRAIGNVQLWLPITFHILTLAPNLFFSYFLVEVEWLSSWVPMPGHYLKPGGSEPVWSSMKCSGVEKQPEEFAVLALSIVLFLSHSHCLTFFISCFWYKIFVEKHILQIVKCEEPWEWRLAVSGWSAHSYRGANC